MIVFERPINRINDILSLLWKNGNILLFINIGLAIGEPIFYSKNIYLIESILVLILVILLSSKRNRIINRLIFYDETKKLEVEYSNWFKSISVEFPYSLINYAYRDKMYGRFITRKTLEIFNAGTFIAEIRERDNFGWKNDTIKTVVEKLKRL